MDAVKLIIAGSRTITDIDLIESALCNPPYEIIEIVSGGCRGVDLLGEKWASQNGFPVKTFPAYWEFGNDAGIKRNCKMALYADAFLALWDGKSKGTKHMIDAMRSLRKPVQVVLVSSPAKPGESNATPGPSADRAGVRAVAVPSVQHVNPNVVRKNKPVNNGERAGSDRL